MSEALPNLVVKRISILFNAVHGMMQFSSPFNIFKPSFIAYAALFSIAAVLFCNCEPEN